MSIERKDKRIALSERKKVGMLLPPPVLLFALILIAIAFQLVLLGSFTFSVVRSIVGSAIVVLSLFVIGICIIRFNASATPFRVVSPTTVIVTSGLYRMTRNPMYVGMAGLLPGLSLLLGSYVFLVLMLPFLLIVHFGVALPEERYLEALHGETYRHYKRTVRRWL